MLTGIMHGLTKMIIDLVRNYKSDLIAFVKSGEGVSQTEASRAVLRFDNEIRREFQKDPKDEPFDVVAEGGLDESFLFTKE
jgi:hypothetical protein